MSNRREFARQVLGPIFVDFLDRLDQTIFMFSTKRSASILFMARAGVRIRKLYELYLDQTGRSCPAKLQTFYASRFLCTKALWNKSPDHFYGMISKEFGWNDVGTIVSALLNRSQEKLLSIDLSHSDFKLPSSMFKSWLEGKSVNAGLIRAYLDEQSFLFDKYVSGLVAGADTALIVDSGWQGTSQRLLHIGWGSHIDWWGAYFGKSFFKDSDRSISHNMIGLAFEADTYDLFDPITSVILHRHIIEHILEPLGKSAEQLAVMEGNIVSDAADSLEGEIVDENSSSLYLGICDYIKTIDPSNTRSAVVQLSRTASAKLACSINFPDRSEAILLGRFGRSADFGRNLDVPTIISSSNNATSDAELRISGALWKAGQIALEYDDDVATARMQQQLGMKILRTELDYIGLPRSKIGFVGKSENWGSVSIVMRTMDRRSFLRRALHSVALQRYDNYRLFVVCDGGNIEAVAEEIKFSSLDPRKVVLIDNVVNRGMEASSNIGISLSESDYILVHDDDDTLQPDFLSKTLSYLAMKPQYGGVVTHSWHVSEEVTSDGIVERKKFPYNAWMVNVSMMEMACGNFFPPISFVFRRSIYNEIGGFDENLPVLGDWDFNLRFLSSSDIGVISEKLANYHHRDVGNKQLFANSVVGEISKHAEFNSVVRNKLLRSQDLSHVGALVGLGQVLDDVRREIRSLSEFKQRNSNVFSAVPDRDNVLMRSDLLWTMLADLSFRADKYERDANQLKAVLDKVFSRSDVAWVRLHSSKNLSSE